MLLIRTVLPIEFVLFELSLIFSEWKNRSQRTENIKLQPSRLQSSSILFGVGKDLPLSEPSMAGQTVFGSTF